MKPKNDLRLARKIAGVTRQTLAARAGVPEPTIAAIESRREDYRQASYETIVRLAEALGLENPTGLFPITGAQERLGDQPPRPKTGRKPRETVVSRNDG